MNIFFYIYTKVKFTNLLLVCHFASFIRLSHWTKIVMLQGQLLEPLDHQQLQVKIQPLSTGIDKPYSFLSMLGQGILFPHMLACVILEGQILSNVLHISICLWTIIFFLFIFIACCLHSQGTENYKTSYALYAFCFGCYIVYFVHYI